MKKSIIATLLLAILGFAPAYADESPEAVCTAEAKEAGIEDPEELKAYVEDCVAQLTQESGAEGGTGSGDSMR